MMSGHAPCGREIRAGPVVLCNAQTVLFHLILLLVRLLKQVHAVAVFDVVVVVVDILTVVVIQDLLAEDVGVLAVTVGDVALVTVELPPGGQSSYIFILTWLINNRNN